MNQQETNANLGWIREELERRLIVLRYSKPTVYHYRKVMGWIEDFLNGYGEAVYSKAMGQRFIAEYRLQVSHNPSMFKSARTVVRRIDEIIEGKLFTPRFRERGIECPPHFVELQGKYLDHLVKRGSSNSTITSRKRYTDRLLARLPISITNIKNLSSADLYNVFIKHDWPSVSYSVARGFLSFLYKSGMVKTDLSVCVPNPARPRPLPSVYSGDEVARMLSAVDRSTSLGKRDYAFLMIAAKLGLRSCDIVNLSFGDIDRVAKTIKVVQVKTSRPLTLVLNSDVEEAIDDCLKYGRPRSSSEKVFLGARAPYAPLTAASGYAIVHKYMELAGIAALGRRRGPQALRQSFATALVAKGVPYSIVKEALGHEDPESAKHYVRVDVKRLRPCAINVPKPVGTFAVLLGDLKGIL